MPATTPLTAAILGAAGGDTASKARRLSTIGMLARGIAENLPKGLPAVMGVPIAESRSSFATISGGTYYGIDGSSVANDRRHHFGLYGADWRIFGSNASLIAHTVHSGNGSDPSANYEGGPSGTVRIATFADRFEIGAINGGGFRLKVNGKYTKTGMYGVQALNGDAAAFRYWLFDFAGTEFAGTGLKLVEFQTAANNRFGGVRVPAAHTVFRWPKALPLKAALHGDSMVGTVSDTGTVHETAQHGLLPHIVQTLTGAPDIWHLGIGGAGFVADAGGTRSDFIEQLAADFAGKRYDLVWELGGRNDAASYGSEAAYRAVVESWIAGILADNADTIIVMTGPLSVQNSESYQSNAAYAAIQRAKKAACAAFPQNCAFIETGGNAVTNDPWVFGTGKQGATAGNGNADIVRGNDGTHFAVFGHWYGGSRLVAETGQVLPLLASRIRDGVIAGVNDLDLAA